MIIFTGFILGAGAGVVISHFYIFPNDLLDLKFVNMTVDAILHILVGLAVVLGGGALGAGIGFMFYDD